MKVSKTNRNWLLPILMLSVMQVGCAQFKLPWQREPSAPVAVTPSSQVPPVEKSETAKDDVLPPLDVIVVAFHRQCESPASTVTIAGDSRQGRELAAWLKRNCSLNENTTASQLVTLKRLRNVYQWPESYAAWLDEWRRDLQRLQQWQQRALTAESEQKQIVKKLKAIENDLITRP